MKKNCQFYVVKEFDTQFRAYFDSRISRNALITASVRFWCLVQLSFTVVVVEPKINLGSNLYSYYEMQGKEQDSDLNDALGPDLSPDQPDEKVTLRPTLGEFNTIFDWFTDPHSKDLHSRQILAVEKFCKKFIDGFVSLR